MKQRKAEIAVPMESAEQIAFFQWFRLAFPKVIGYHIPNGGKRSLRTAVRLKKEGVLASVLDINIDKRCGPYGGMRIEMKRRKGGSLSDGQKEMVSKLREEGYYVAVCKGWEEARDAVLTYFGFGEPVILG